MQKHCSKCNSDKVSIGSLELPGEAGVIFHNPSEDNHWLTYGVDIVSTVCLDCGNVDLNLDPDKLKKIINT